MELSPLNFKTLILLNVTGEIKDHDLGLLSVGIPKMASEGTAVVLDLLNAKSNDKVSEKLSELIKKMLSAKINLIVVSTTIKDVQAKTITDAITKSNVKDAEQIIEVLSLRKELIEVEKKESELVKKTGMEDGVNQGYKSLVIENRILSWTLSTLQDGIKFDSLILAKLQSKMSEKKVDRAEANKIKAEILSLMKDKGVQLTRA